MSSASSFPTTYLYSQPPSTTLLVDDSEANGPGSQTVVAVGTFSYYIYYILLIVAIFIMLAWPWILFGIVWHRGGLEMYPRLAKVVKDHPQGTSFFATLIGSFVLLIISFLFSTAFTRFAEKWVIDNTNQERRITVFHISLLAAFKDRKIPWSISDLFVGKRYLAALPVLFCMGAFALIVSATVSLISPASFKKRVDFPGMELDFTSTTADCIKWSGFNPNLSRRMLDHPPPPSGYPDQSSSNWDPNPVLYPVGPPLWVPTLPSACSWTTLKDMKFTTCLGASQLGDILESGRNNILSLKPSNSEMIPFTQLGGRGGLRFFGPLRGVVPLGPDGINIFDTHSYFPSSDTHSYNYTVELQGLLSRIKCVYDNQSPIRFSPVSGDTYVYQYNGTCPGPRAINILTRQFIPLNSTDRVGFWACKSAGADEQYTLYLRGDGTNYESGIGNITCTLSPVQIALFPVTYWSQLGYFSSQENTTTFANTNISSHLIQLAVVTLGDIMYESQNSQNNLVVDVVISYGVKSSDLTPNKQNDTYLQLYEAMYQGILEYAAAYIRLVYMTTTDPLPPSCIRNMTGSANYTVIGWSVTSANIGFLMPMTLVNLAALILALMAMFMGNKVLHKFDPTDMRALIFASGESQGILESWNNEVSYKNESVTDNDPDRNLSRP